MQGSFGRLFKGDYLGVDVAIKNLFMTDDAEEDAKYLAREISALKYEITLPYPSFFFCKPNFNFICSSEEFATRMW